MGFCRGTGQKSESIGHVNLIQFSDDFGRLTKAVMELFPMLMEHPLIWIIGSRLTLSRVLQGSKDWNLIFILTKRGK